MECKLEDIANVTMGQSPKSEFYNNEGDGLPFLQGNRTFGRRYPTFDTYTTKITKRASAGDVIMSVRAPVGDLNITPVDMCLGRGVCGIRMKNGKQDFLYYLLKYNMQQLLNKEAGTVFGSVNRNDINGLVVDIPDDETQDKIASFLGQIDHKIENNEAINRNLLDQGRALYEDLISKYEINAKLSDLISSIETGSRPKGGAQESGVPSIGAEKIESFGVYDYSGEKHISEEFFEKSKRGHILSGDVLLYKDGAYTGKTSMALNDFPHAKCAINEHVYKLNSNNNLYQFFLYFTLDNKKNRDYIYTLASSKAAQPGLNQTELLSVDIAMPVETSLIEFEKNVSEMMNMIASNAKENRKLTLLRDSLLPKLMSGEIDVSELDV